MRMATLDGYPVDCTLRLPSTGARGHDGAEITLRPAAADHFGNVMRRGQAVVYEGPVSDDRESFQARLPVLLTRYSPGPRGVARIHIAPAGKVERFDRRG